MKVVPYLAVRPRRRGPTWSTCCATGYVLLLVTAKIDALVGASVALVVAEALCIRRLLMMSIFSWVC